MQLCFFFQYFDAIRQIYFITQKYRKNTISNIKINTWKHLTLGKQMNLSKLFKRIVITQIIHLQITHTHTHTHTHIYIYIYIYIICH